MTWGDQIFEHDNAGRGTSASTRVEPELRPWDDGPPELMVASARDRATALWPALALAGAAAVVVAGLVFRFWTRSDLWLDEALTVNVARLPLHRLPAALRHDGAPPLYYVLLHFWTGVFGTSDAAVRSLSGVFSVAALPLMWVAGTRAGGRERGRVTAVAAVILLASSPFAVRYATETRMYSLIVLLVLIGYLALTAAVDSEGSAPVALGGVALVTALLLYTHYWALYLIALVGGVLLGKGRRARGSVRQKYLSCLVAMAAGGVLFVPWLPSLVFQLRHTGTPWAEPASFSAMVNAVSEFAGGRSSTGRALGLTFFALAGFGLFGAPIDSHRIEIDLRTRPWARGVTAVTAGTLIVAITVGLVSHSTFASRYTAVVYVPFILLVALGTSVLTDARIRAAMLAGAAAVGLITCTLNVRTNRTEAGKVAAAITAAIKPGDVVAYCPDQLGPGTSRLLPESVDQVTYPRAARPQFVDWVDYADHNAAGDPVAFARLLDARAGPGHSVWMVWSPQYRTLGIACERINQQLVSLRPAATEVVPLDVNRYFEHADLVRYAPR